MQDRKLFELRACWEEFYDCPEEGRTKVCDTYETIAFAFDDDTALKEIVVELEKGYPNGWWSEHRCKQLRKLYSGFDDFRATEYKIVEVTDWIL